MKVLLPALNSPTIATRSGRSRSTARASMRPSTSSRSRSRDRARSERSTFGQSASGSPSAPSAPLATCGIQRAATSAARSSAQAAASPPTRASLSSAASTWPASPSRTASTSSARSCGTSAASCAITAVRAGRSRFSMAMRRSASAAPRSPSFVARSRASRASARRPSANANAAAHAGRSRAPVAFTISRAWSTSTASRRAETTAVNSSVDPGVSRRNARSASSKAAVGSPEANATRPRSSAARPSSGDASPIFATASRAVVDVAERQRALRAAQQHGRVRAGEQHRDALQPVAGARRVAGREVHVAEVEQRLAGARAVVGGRGGALQRVARLRVAGAQAGASEAEPDVRAEREALPELREGRHHLVIEPRVLRGVRPEREADERVRDLFQDVAGGLAGVQRAVAGEGGLGRPALVVQAEREDLDPPHEPRQPFEDARHAGTVHVYGVRIKRAVCTPPTARAEGTPPAARAGAPRRARRRGGAGGAQPRSGEHRPGVGNGSGAAAWLEHQAGCIVTTTLPRLRWLSTRAWADAICSNG